MRKHTRSLRAADGSHVAWDVAGAGEPAVLLCNGLSTDTHFWRYLLPALEAEHRVVTFDLKGHGDSAPARTAAGASIEGVADDALRALDAAGVERAVICGFSMGCQVAVELHRRAPRRVLALALLLGPAGRVFDTALGPAGTVLRHLMTYLPGAAIATIMPGISRLGGTPIGPVVGRRLGLIGEALTDGDVQGIVGHWGRLHGPSLRHLAVAAGQYDARPHLASVDVPTLVVAGDRDVFAPPATVGLPIAAAVPGARLVRMPHGTHASTLEHADEVIATLSAFLRELPTGP